MHSPQLLVIGGFVEKVDAMERRVASAAGVAITSKRLTQDCYGGRKRSNYSIRALDREETRSPPLNTRLYKPHLHSTFTTIEARHRVACLGEKCETKDAPAPLPRP